MNITPTSSSIIAQATAPLSGNSPTAGGVDPDGDGDGGRVHSSRGRGAHLQQALMQALQSLGLGQPQTASATGSTGTTSGSSDSDGDSDGTTGSASSVKQDMRQFMHALFQAVKNQSSGAATSSDGTPASGKTNFAAGLSALITQVSNGSAPTDLQTAFSKLVTDLQGAASTTGPIGDTGSSTEASASATLQALLSKLQDTLGYGASPAAALGNLVSTHA